MSSAAIKPWRHIFGGQRGYLCIFSGHRTEGRDRLEDERIRYFEFPGQVEDAARYAAEESATGRETYFCAHLLRARRRVKENAGAVAALWCELDGAEIPNGRLKPTAVVESSPGHYHVYWRLTDALSPQVAEQFNKRLAQQIGADTSGFDLTQLLRVPGTVNHKYPSRPVVKLLEMQPGRAYAPTDLDELLPPLSQGSRRIHRGGVGEPPVPLSPADMKAWTGERHAVKPDGSVDRSDTLWWIGCGLARGLRETPLTDEAKIRLIRDAVAERDVALGYLKYADRRDDTEYNEIASGALEEAVKEARIHVSDGREPLPPEPLAGATAGKPLAFRTAKEIAEATPAEVKWYAPPWVAKGAITEIDGKIKAAGKTTFASYMVAAVLDGEPFMGEPTQQTRVVWLTEQPPTSFRRVLERAKLTEREDLYVLHWHDASGVEWSDVASAATEKALEVGAELLVVDTLGQFAGIRGDGENNAGSAQEAMKPLQEAAARGLAVAFTRHERKGGGEVGESGRGSSAFGGGVDIILSIRRGDGNTRPPVRIIETLSRFDETPDKLVVELTDEGYRSLGDATAFAEREAQGGILDVLPAKPENAVKTDDLLDKLKEQDIKRTVAQTALTRLIAAGQVVRIGEGKRGNPYRHYKPENVSADLKDELAAEIKSAADDAATPDAQKDSAATRVPSGGNNTDGRAEGVELATSEDEKLSAATSTYRAAERNGERNPWPHNPMRFYDRGGGL